jgi:hypothetical protein
MAPRVLFIHPRFFRRTLMAKGQMRSNREQKKPKKDKTKPVAPAIPFGGGQGGATLPKK